MIPTYSHQCRLRQLTPTPISVLTGKSGLQMKGNIDEELSSKEKKSYKPNVALISPVLPLVCMFYFCVPF